MTEETSKYILSYKRKVEQGVKYTSLEVTSEFDDELSLEEAMEAVLEFLEVTGYSEKSIEAYFNNIKENS